MAEQSSGWDAARIGAALAALVGAFKFLFRARRENAHDRIKRLERQIEDFRQVIEDVPAAVESIGNRMRHQEVGLSDLRREMRDSLAEIEETVKRAIRKLEAD